MSDSTANMMHDVGDVVWVVGHDYFSPFLMKTTVLAVLFNADNQPNYRLAGWHDNQTANSLHANEADARTAFKAKVEAIRNSRFRERTS